MHKHTYTTGRITQSSFCREKRLCYNIFESLGGGLGTGANFIANAGIDTTSAMYNSFVRAWNADKRSAEEKERAFQSIAEFKRQMPKSITNLIEKQMQYETPTLKQLEELLNMHSWVRAFENVNLQAVAVPYTSLADGPEALLASLPPDARQAAFHDFVSSIIPPAVQRDAGREYQSLFGSSTDKAQRAAQLTRNKNSAIATMQLMFGQGTSVPRGSSEYTLAQKSIMHHYWRDGIREVNVDGKKHKLSVYSAVRPDEVNGKKLGNGAKVGLIEDIESQAKAMSGVASVADLEQQLSPSLLKGAFALGAIENSDFGQLDHILNARSVDRSLGKQDVTSKVLGLSKAVERQNAKEMKTFTDTFRDMSGVEKVALVVFAVYLIKKFPKLSMSLGGLYFAQKFLLKQENPIDETWSPIVTGIAQKTQKLAKEPLKAIGINTPSSADVEELRLQSEAMSKFVSEYTKNDVESAAVGFALLADMPLNMLNMYLDTGVNNSTSILNAKDRNFKKLVKQSLQRRGLSSTAASRFFDDENPDLLIAIQEKHLRDKYGDSVSKNLIEAGNALSFIYYDIASRNLGPDDTRQKIVEHARRETSGSYDDLPQRIEYQGKMYNPALIYMELVREGMNDAPNTTLGDYVEHKVAATTDTPDKQAERLQRDFEVKAKRLFEYKQNGVAYNIVAVRENGVVHIGPVPQNTIYKPLTYFTNTINYPLILPLDQFLLEPEDDLLESWKSTTKNKVDFAPGSAPIEADATTLPEVRIRFAGNKVEIETGLGTPVAKTALTNFENTELRAFYEAVDEWRANGADPAIDPLA